MIDKELAAFLQEGIAIQIGTRNANLEPNGARVVAIKVEDDGQHVVAHVPRQRRRRWCRISSQTDKLHSCSRVRPTSECVR